MRRILSVSLPNELAQYVEKQVKKRKFPSVSEYVRHAIGLERNMITEDELLERGKEALAAHKAGKTKILRSLEDLL